jgi:hypothetical protein
MICTIGAVRCQKSCAAIDTSQQLLTHTHTHTHSHICTQHISNEVDSSSLLLRFQRPARFITVNSEFFLHSLFVCSLQLWQRTTISFLRNINPLNNQLNPIFHLLALLEAHLILHVSRIRVKIIRLCNASKLRSL